MKPAKAIILFLAVTAPLHIARAQASFDAGEGCLNVVEVSYAQGIGEYGDGGISANYLHEKFINERFSIGAGIGYNHHEKYKLGTIIMRSTSFLQFPYFLAHIISFLTSSFRRLSIYVLEESPCSTQRM